jgi:hypothetical protein
MHLGGSERGHAAALAAVIIWALVPVGTRFFVLRVDPIIFNVIRFVASGAASVVRVDPKILAPICRRTTSQQPLLAEHRAGFEVHRDCAPEFLQQDP